MGGGCDRLQQSCKHFRLMRRSKVTRNAHSRVSEIYEMRMRKQTTLPIFLSPATAILKLYRTKGTINVVRSPPRDTFRAHASVSNVLLSRTPSEAVTLSH